MSKRTKACHSVTPPLLYMVTELSVESLCADVGCPDPSSTFRRRLVPVPRVDVTRFLVPKTEDKRYWSLRTRFSIPIEESTGKQVVFVFD